MSDNTMILTTIRTAAGRRQLFDVRLADEERKRRERLRPVVIPAGCLSAAICK